MFRVHGVLEGRKDPTTRAPGSVQHYPGAPVFAWDVATLVLCHGATGVSMIMTSGGDGLLVVFQDIL